ncbi:MAG: FAD-dependent oxidoreductase [Steroidobacteraceae bacterium]|nr:FAD-dependent oxidoreductase [Nevskiaceae bacterium]MCP5360432.1 FAD-dependent oxidoreductase [Nevskiaceae bacterium]
MGILRDSQLAFEHVVPVAVVGAGACGLTAALAARDAGAEVLVLERDKHPAGSTAMSLGAMCAAASAEHRRHGIEDSAERFVADVMAKTQGRADPRLARAIAEQSGPAVDWLTENHDVPLRLDFKWTSLGHSVPRLHLPPGRNGEELLSLLGRACERAEVAVMTEARVRDLHAGPDGRIRGIRIERPDGHTEDLGVDTLVLACCGFGGHRDMVAQHIPDMANSRYFGHEGNQGDAIHWGQALGAQLADMSAYQGLGTLADPQQVIVPHPLLLEGGFMVNLRGERFTHENANISGMCVPVLAQPEGLAWVVFDGRRNTACLAHSVEQRQLAELGAIKQATSWDELEQRCNLPRGSLERENSHIDAARRAGQVDAFGRRFDGLEPLQPPYCALRVTGALFHTQGGLVVDGQARVLRPDGSALPNLFAGGGAARSISGPMVTGYLPGVGLCMAITLGRLAGDAAAKSSQRQPS